MRRDVFQAIADPIRRKIIDHLSEQPLSVNIVASRFKISRPAISKHLKVLHECDIIDMKQQGRERICHLKPKKLSSAFFWLNQYRDAWENREGSFARFLTRLETSAQDGEKDIA
jgi:DNA-binding transcriptional ArsR family regulator